MHGQSAGPSYTQQGDEEGKGGRRDGGIKRAEGRKKKTTTFGLICRSGQQKFLWYVFIAWLRWRKHHGVI